MDNSSSFHRITRSQRRKRYEKTFDVEISNDDNVLDRDDDEHFSSSEDAASDCDDTADEIVLNDDEHEESENGEYENEESVVAATGSGMMAKDGTQWAATPPSEHPVGRRNIVRERCWA